MHPLGGVASGSTMPSGEATASCACCWVIMPWPSIWLMTSLRRPVAACGWRVGSNWVVDCTMPASSAACGTVSRSGVVLKYVRAAAATP